MLRAGGSCFSFRTFELIALAFYWNFIRRTARKIAAWLDAEPVFPK